MRRMQVGVLRKGRNPKHYPQKSCRAEGYTATDIMARMRRMQGYNVLHPIGWDAFGLPAEQYALQTGTHPAVTTGRNIARFRQQLQALGAPLRVGL